MVIGDITEENSKIKNGQQVTLIKASLHQRILSVLIDYFIFTPIVSFLLVNFFYDGLYLYKKFPTSDESLFVLFFLGLGFVVLFSFLQALFIYFFKGTPGQIFTKTFVHFENEHVHLFFQAWTRQLVFALSFFMMGIPFLAILFHTKKQAFYERMTESIVLTTVHTPFDYIMSDQERNYLRASFAAISFFVLFLGTASLFSMYKKTLNSFVSFSHIQEKDYFCSEVKNIKQENRLIVATALNITGILSDRCLDKEAEFVLWKMEGLKGFDLYYNPSMAYFAKYLTANDVESEDEYLKMSCQLDVQSYGCFLSTAFQNKSYEEFLNELNKRSEINLLTTTLKYELADLSEVKSTGITLSQFDPYSNLDLVKKFVLLEKVKSLKNTDQRFPASITGSQNKDKQIEEIIKGINEL